MLSVPVPPDDLLYLVSGHTDREAWQASRRAAVIEVISLLGEAGVDVTKLRSRLDFGCGCGRILAGWEGLLGGARLIGVDINPKLVDFCRANVPFAVVEQCAAHPPLPFRSGSFDLVYAASVFTHMTETALSEWAAEMARLVVADGVLMVSYHGGSYLSDMERFGAQPMAELHSRGCYVHLHGRAEDTFEGSNYHATYMTDAFANSLFAGFDTLLLRRASERGPCQFAAYQDILVLRRRQGCPRVGKAWNSNA